MTPFRTLTIAWLTLALGLAGLAARAAEDPMRFLLALQQKGYGDMAPGTWRWRSA